MDNQDRDLEFCVVEFVEENSVEVVPREWILEDSEAKDGKICWFPRSDVKRNVLLKRKPNESWQLWPAKVVRYSRSYEAAEKALESYLDVSDIELYSDNEPRKSLSRASKIVKPNQITNPLFSPLPADYLFSSPPPAKKFNSGRQPESVSGSSTREESASPCTTCVENQTNIQALMSKMGELMEEMKTMQQGMRAIAQKLDVGRVERSEVEKLQIADTGELQVLEQELEANEKYSQMVRDLGNFGGRDCNEVTRRILAALLSNEAACQLNWVGGFGKLGMKTFPRVLQMISVAVRQNPSTKHCKQADVEAIVKRWLRTAADRNGGRNKRKACQAQLENCEPSNEKENGF